MESLLVTSLNLMRMGHGKPAPTAGSYALSGGASEVGVLHEEVTAVNRSLLQEAPFRRSQSAGVILHASKHTSMGHGPAHHGRYCMMVSHICEIVVDR